MPLNKQSDNNEMYSWIKFTWSPLGGECSDHNCKYCYVIPMKKRPVIANKYTGPPGIMDKELRENLYKYGKGITIFVQNMSDLFAKNVPSDMISRVLAYCNVYPENTYLLQTKNPRRFLEFVDRFPPNVLLGTTIESDKDWPITDAPTPMNRYMNMTNTEIKALPKMVNVEPVLDFSIGNLLRWLKDIPNLQFVSIGADSKRLVPLVEPTGDKVRELIEGLKMAGIEVRLKKNLERIMGVL